MKNCLFILSDFERGGIPRVTLNLLGQLDTSKLKAEVFCGNHHGIFEEMFAKCHSCEVFPPSAQLQALMCHKGKATGGYLIFVLFLKFVRHACLKLFQWDYLEYLVKKLGRKLSRKQYDCVFATNEGLAADLALTVECGKRYVWIHNDYAHDSSVKQVGLVDKLSRFDGVLCVAEHARKTLIELFPELVNKARTLYNVVNTEEIAVKAQENELSECYPDTDGIFKIVSVGRFYDTQKKFSLIPMICAELKQKGLKFRWYLIGNGSPAETSIIQNAVDEYQSGGTFVMLGEKSNPYPYIKHADLFAITSKYETYPTVVNEALALGTPVIATPFKGVDEILAPADGQIVSIEQFAAVIAGIIECGVQSHAPKSFEDHNCNVLKKFTALIDA